MSNRKNHRARSLNSEIQDTRRLICRLLQKVSNYSLIEWKKEKEGTTRRVPPQAMELYEYLYKKRYGTQPEEIESLLLNTNDLSVVLKKPLYLPPLPNDSEFIPILQMKCYLNNVPIKTRLGIGMIKRIGTDFDAQGVGFRFESAHGTGGHNYDHVQLCSGPFDDKYLNEFLNCPSWLPMEWPAFVISTSHPVSLICCMLVSFYGTEVFDIVDGLGIKFHIHKLSPYFPR